MINYILEGPLVITPLGRHLCCRNAVFLMLLKQNDLEDFIQK